MLSSISSRCRRLLASLLLLFFLARGGSERCFADAAPVSRSPESARSGGRGESSFDSTPPPSSTRPRPRSNDKLITSIARLRSLVTPSAAHLPGCVLFLNATSARAAGCSATRKRRMRQDPPPSFPLVAGVPVDEGNGEGDPVILALRAGEDAALLDLLMRPSDGGNSTAGGDDEGEKRRERLLSAVAGVVALPGPPPEDPWSPDDPNPQSEYCPYPIPSNFTGWVAGSRGLLRRPLPFPVVAAYGELASAVAAAAGVGDDEGRRRSPSSSHLAALDDEMEAAVPPPGTSNSSHCLSRGTCGPIGGHSVWASLPAMRPKAKTTSAPDDGGQTPTPPPPPSKNSSAARTVVLAAASDARQLLHGGTAGAGALSGLVSLLAAAEALGNATRSFSKNSTSSPFGEGGRVLFVALAAEPWGFLGSRRLLWEARDRGTNGTSGGGGARGNDDDAETGARDDAAGGFPLSDVSWLIELGSVGDPSDASDVFRLFAHPGTTAGSKEGPAAALVGGGADGGGNSTRPFDVSLPPGSLPGPPPGSLWAWATAAPSVSSALLSAHGSSVGGRWSSSRWDDASRLDARGVAAAAAVAARAAASAAGASPDFLGLAPADASPPFLSAEAALPRVVDLISCLIAKEPGLGGGGTGKAKPTTPPCPLSLELLGREGTLEAAAASLDGGGTPHHAGPLATLTADPQNQNPLAKRPYSRFLWEFLARATREEGDPSAAPLPCDPTARRGADGSCPAGRVCARAPSPSPSRPSSSPSVCVDATVAFVASYPLNLECVGCDGAENYGNWRVFEAATGNKTDEERERERKLLPSAAAAEAWRESLGWPIEPLWAESNWREGVPSLSVWRVASPSSGSTPSSGVFVLWSLAVAATAGCWAAATAAKEEMRTTRRDGSDDDGDGGGERGGGQRDLFVPSF